MFYELIIRTFNSLHIVFFLSDSSSVSRLLRFLGTIDLCWTVDPNLPPCRLLESPFDHFGLCSDTQLIVVPCIQTKNQNYLHNTNKLYNYNLLRVTYYIPLINIRWTLRDFLYFNKVVFSPVVFFHTHVVSYKIYPCLLVIRVVFIIVVVCFWYWVNSPKFYRLFYVNHECVRCFILVLSFIY